MCAKASAADLLYRCFLIPRYLQQTILENVVEKEKIACFEPQCFQLFFSNYNPLFIKIFHVFTKMFSNSSAADLLYVGKG